MMSFRLRLMRLTRILQDVLLEGEIECPNCGELLEFDFSDIFDGEECDPENCEGCGSNCNSSEE